MKQCLRTQVLKVDIKEARECFDRMCEEINYGQHLDVLGNLLPGSE